MTSISHEDSRNCIAVDAWIKATSAARGLSFRNYSKEEQFYLAVARDAGLNGWELDRLLFNFQAEFMPALAGSRLRPSPRSKRHVCGAKV